MTDTRQLGVFFGNSALYFVESAESVPKEIFRVPLVEIHHEIAKNGPMSQGGIDLISSIRSALIAHKIHTRTINLSLPTRDVIFRSFVIPWMQQHEIKSVVEFEIGKYIPFSLENLSFSYHPIVFTENTFKRIRIIFVAIKSGVLQTYVDILKESSLQINLIEPEASSLIRALNIKKLLPPDQTIALIEKEDSGRITIIDNEAPQFVREFHLPSPSPGLVNIDPDEGIKKMTKEVRISLDYFNRQNEQLQVKQILLMTALDQQSALRDLEKNLMMPVTTIDTQSVLANTPHTSNGFLKAYGCSLYPTVASKAGFNLAKDRQTSPLSQPSSSKKPINYRSIIKTALVCIPFAVISLITSGLLTQKLKNDIEGLSKQLGPYRDADIEMIEKKELGVKSRMAYFKNIHTRSNAALYLMIFPDLLPDGTWIQSLEITYDDNASRTIADTASSSVSQPPTLTFTIEGNAYSENKNEQFHLVNQLLKNLKDHSKFSETFSDIDLETTKAQRMEDYSVTFFKIVCRKKNAT